LLFLMSFFIQFLCFFFFIFAYFISVSFFSNRGGVPRSPVGE